jgi:hypothetical protein
VVAMGWVGSGCVCVRVWLGWRAGGYAWCCVRKQTVITICGDLMFTADDYFRLHSGFSPGAQNLTFISFYLWTK